MSQILKLKSGDQLRSKKQQELELIQANRDKIQQAYDAGTLSEQTKAQLDMISKNAQSYLEADPLHNRNARKFQLELTNRMVDLVDGGQGYTPYSTEIADKNFFGRYSDKEMGLIANELMRKTLGGNAMEKEGMSSYTSMFPGSQSSVVIDDNSPIRYDSHHVYSWKNPKLEYLQSSSSLRDRLKLVVEGLKENVLAARNAEATKNIHGINSDKLRTAASKITGLDDILANLGKEGGYTDQEAMQKLIDLIADGSFNIDQSEFKRLFPDYFNGSAQEQPTNKTQAIFRNQNLTNYLLNRGLSLEKTNDGKFLLTDAGGNAATNFAETDPTSPYYQWGFFVDPTTKEILGADNLNNPEYVSKFSQQWTDLAPKVKAEYKQNLPIVDYTLQGGKKGIDFSAYLPGQDIRFVETGDFDYDNPDSPAWLPFNQWFSDWDNIKSKFNYKGLADVSTSGSDTKNQYIKSIGGDPELDLSQSVKTYSPAELQTELGKFKGRIREIMPARDYAELDENLRNFIYMYLCSKDSNNPAQSQHKANLEANFPKSKTGGASLLKDIKKENPQLLLQILSQLIGETDDASDRRSLIGWYKETKSNSKLKQGGILHLQNGGLSWDIIENEAESQRLKSKSSGFKAQASEQKTNTDVENARLNEKVDGGFQWKTEDTLRALSLASDLGAIGASNAVGVGTAVAGGLGLVSTGLDYWADSIDKTVTDKQKYQTLGLGIGTTALGIIPDAKALTTGAKSLKFIAGLTRRGLGIGAMLSAGGIAAEDVKRFYELLKDPEYQFTGDDLRLIFNSTRVILSAILGKKMSNKNRAISDAISKETRYFKTKGANGSETKVELTKDQFDKIVEVGKSKGQEEADKLFRQIAGNQVAKDAVFPVNFGNSWYGRTARNIQHTVGKVAPGFPGATSYNSYQRVPNTKVELAAKGPDKMLATWGQWEGLNINLPKWLDLTATPEIKVNTKQTVPQQAAIPTPKHSAKSTTKKKTPKKPTKKEAGGKLERLNNYIKNK